MQTVISPVSRPVIIQTTKIESRRGSAQKSEKSPTLKVKNQKKNAPKKHQHRLVKVVPTGPTAGPLMEQIWLGGQKKNTRATPDVQFFDQYLNNSSQRTSIVF